MIDRNKIEDLLIRHEGLKLKPYKCTAGKLTIGVGRNLDDNGITEAEARMMLKYDIEVARHQLLKHKWFTILNDVRKDVMINMAFNLGYPRLMQFKNMLSCLAAEDYEGAATEMLNSKWAQQVGDRAVELASMIISGKYLKSP